MLLCDELAAEKDAKGLFWYPPISSNDRSLRLEVSRLPCKSIVINGVRSKVQLGAGYAIFLVQSPICLSNVEELIDAVEESSQYQPLRHALQQRSVFQIVALPSHPQLRARAASHRRRLPIASDVPPLNPQRLRIGRL